MDPIESPMPGPSELEFGHYLGELRRALGMDTGQLAARSGLGLEVILALERGQHAADLVSLQKLAEGLGVRLGVLFTLWEQGALKQSSKP